MLVLYKLSGINAIVAMAVNLLVLLALMVYFDATMTLPGIAGLHPDDRHGRRQRTC